MGLAFDVRMEAYYQKFIELQEKLRRSEEERLKLEMKFNEMMQISREEEQAHYRKLRNQYKKFLDEDRRRQERNENIFRTLERIETRIDMLTSKAERLKSLRRQYRSYLDRTTRREPIQMDPKMKMDSRIVTQNGDTLRHPAARSSEKNNQERLELLDKYLQTLNSHAENKCEHKTEKVPDYTDDLRKLDSLSQRLHVGFDSNKANNIAEDIMNSICSRHYKRNDTAPGAKHASKFDNDYDDESADNEDNCSTKSNYTKGKEMFAHHPKLQSHSILDHVGLLKNETLFEKSKLPYITSTNKNVSYSDYKKPTESENINKRFVGIDQNLVDSTLARNNDQSNINGHVNNSIRSLENQRLASSHVETSTINEDQDQKHDKVSNIQQPPNEESSNNIVGIVDKSDENLRQETNAVPEDYIHVITDEVAVPKSKETGHGIHETKYEEESQDLSGQTINKYIDKDQIFQSHQKENVIFENKNTDELTIKYDNDEEHAPQSDKKETDEGDNDTHEIQQEYLDEKDTQRYGQHDENGQPLDQAYADGKPQRYDQNGEKYGENEKHENDQPIIPCDQTEQQIENYNENTQLYEESGQLLEQNYSGFTQYDENGQIMPQYDENDKSLIQYDENGQPNLQYDEQGQLTGQYDENGQPFVQYDDNGRAIVQYDENGQPIIHYGEQGEPIVQYDEHGQPILHYDENGQPIVQYDENGQHMVHYDEQGQPMVQYDENGQPIIQYDEQGQPISHYDENGQPIIQYDEQGQPISHYDENGQPIIQYDEQGQPMSHYDENGQTLLQYDQQDQPIVQYDRNGQPITQYDEQGQPIELYDEHHLNLVQYDENLQPITESYDVNQTIIQANEQYNENGQPSQGVSEELQEKDLQDRETASFGEKVKHPNDSSDTTGNEIEVPQENVAKNTIDVLDVLDTDTESIKQNTSKITNDSDFDFSNG